MYLGEESLTGPELTEEPETEETPENEVTVVTEEENSEVTEEPEVVTEDYVVLTATFKALKAGTHTVTVKDNEYFNNATYLVLAEDLVASVDVVVNKSDDNTLSYLEVAGQVIALVEGKFEYEVSVDNKNKFVIAKMHADKDTLNNEFIYFAKLKEVRNHFEKDGYVCKEEKVK